MKIFLYRYDKITGYWVTERGVTEDTAEEWHKIFSSDSPGEYFTVAKRRPSHNPTKGGRHEQG